MQNQPVERPDDGPEKPPVFSSWNRLYAAVLLNLALLIALFFLITKFFE